MQDRGELLGARCGRSYIPCAGKPVSAGYGAWAGGYNVAGREGENQ